MVPRGATHRERGSKVNEIAMQAVMGRAITALERIAIAIETQTEVTRELIDQGERIIAAYERCVAE